MKRCPLALHQADSKEAQLAPPAEISKPLPLRQKGFKLLVAVACLSATGCHLDGTSFQMNSDSGIPFLGFSLSDSGRRPVEVTPVVNRAQNGDGESSIATRRKPGFNRWLENVRDTRVRISLPRTDVQHTDTTIASTTDASNRANEL